jgi:SOS-response transcriptional repressor LexA
MTDAIHETAARLFEAAKILKKTEGKPSEIARLLNVSDQTVTNWARRGVSREGMLTAQRVIGCSATWLESGTGAMIAPGIQHISSADESARRAHNPGLIAGTPEKSGTMIGNDDAPRRKLPDSSYSARYAGDNYAAGPDLKKSRLYPEISWVQAGMWTEIADTKMHQSHIDLGEDGFVLRVEGQSMTAPPGVFPTFPHGFLLYVRPHEDVMPGKHVIVRRNGNTATFKKLVTIDGDLYLEALNPDWPNQYMRVQGDDVFCGVVMHAGFDL